MMDHLLAFVFMWIEELATKKQDMRQAVSAVECMANQVITHHNSGKDLCYANTGTWTDNQCVFSQYLDRDTKYALITLPKPVLRHQDADDVIMAVNHVTY